MSSKSKIGGYQAMPDIIDMFQDAADSIHEEYSTGRSVLTYGEYIEELAKEPELHLRDASRYLLDAIDYFGSEKVERPWGTENRYKIFDQDFGRSSEALVGQEPAQAAVRSAVASQVHDGRVNRLVVIHGPNGSAKSTLIRCLFSGLDEYSRLDEGALYRFRWIFPTRKTSHGTIGFGARLKRDNLLSFAHLDDEQIEATLECEVRDHPLLLLPKSDRIRIIEGALKGREVEGFQLPELFRNAALCHRCRQVTDALMRTHHGDIRKVLAHVQVERWAMSRRYRRGTVLVGPQISVDAGERQVTADRSLAALPIELQNMTLFETYGPLVDGSGGIVQFDDMLKRPIDAFKYLLSTIETGEVQLGHSILKLNTVLLATTNDTMLEAFRDHHEYPSFRDRLTVIPVPYMTQYSVEQDIYEKQLVPNVKRHVAPHAVRAGAHWAVMTRLHKPDSEKYAESLRPTILKMTAGEKADLYEDGTVPEGLNNEEARELRDAIGELRIEDVSTWSYEGRYGASPRLIRQVLLKASLSDEYECLSPFAVLGELESICDRVREFPFLEREVEAGGYHDTKAFVGFVEERVLDGIERDLRSASGLVDENQYLELMNSYINHVNYLVKGEKLQSETTGAYEDPDESFMKRIEGKLDIKGDAGEFRNELISRIAAWAIDHPKQKVDVAVVFPEYIRRLKDSYFEESMHKVTQIARFAFATLTGQEKGLNKDEKKTGTDLVKRLTKEYGYCSACLKDGLARLFSKRLKSK
jgi:serine protein kinase